MDIMINAQPAPVIPEAGETLGQLFSRLEDHCHQKGLTVISCVLDGRNIDVPEQKELSSQSLDSFASLEVEVVSRDVLAEQTLRELIPLLGRIPQEAETAATALQAGRADEAHARINDVLQVWAVIFETISSASQLHDFSLEDIQCEAGRLDVMIQGLSGVLREIEEALNRQDTVTVADVLEYEIAPVIPAWEQALEALVGHLADHRTDRPI